MDNRHRVYYLLNLNQNYRRENWWSNGWDDYGMVYVYNLQTLNQSINSLKITPNNQSCFSNGYYQMKVSCKKNEEQALVNVLNSLQDVNYMKLTL